MAQNATSDIGTRETIVVADHSHASESEGLGLGGVIIAAVIILALIVFFM